MLTLYYAPHTCALASHIALEDAGAAYELRLIDLRQAQQQSAEYLRVNPKALVPALVTARGVLTETPAILAFVAQSFPSTGLARYRTLLRLPSCNPSPVTSAQPCTLRTPIGCVAIAGPTSQRRLPTCSAKSRSR
jgi:Glutathione S-transferase, N-terminal domain